MRKLNQFLFPLTFIIIVSISLSKAQGQTLQDVDNYNFKPSKVATSSDAFHFLRSFVDLFYLIYDLNDKQLSAIFQIEDQKGWCLGDAHPENFGVLLQNDGHPVFTANDIDDSGPCPLGLDLYRLMVSSQLYNKNTELSQIVLSYQKGLENKTYPPPVILQKMLSKSIENGFAPNPKKLRGNFFKREPEMREITDPLLKKQFKQMIQRLGGVLLDVVATTKDGGGSANLLRYEILFNFQGSLRHIELKEEITPSIYPVTKDLPNPQTRLLKSLLITQGSNTSKLYGAITFNGKTMLMRPRFAGNIGVKLDNATPSENEAVIDYEAYTLGQIHIRSLQNPSQWLQKVHAITPVQWEKDVRCMTNYFENKFQEQKNKSINR